MNYSEKPYKTQVLRPKGYLTPMDRQIVAKPPCFLTISRGISGYMAMKYTQKPVKLASGAEDAVIMAKVPSNSSGHDAVIHRIHISAVILAGKSAVMRSGHDAVMFFRTRCRHFSHGHTENDGIHPWSTK